MPRKLLLLALALASSTCGRPNVSTVRTNPPPRPPEQRSPDMVEVLSVPPADRPYVEIGLIDASQDAFSTVTQAQFIAELKERAGEMGCEAVVLRADTVKGASRSGYRGTCLMFRNPSDAMGGGTASSKGTPGSDPYEKALRNVPPKCRPYKRAIFAAKSPRQRLAAVNATPPECH